MSGGMLVKATKKLKMFWMSTGQHLFRGFFLAAFFRYQTGYWPDSIEHLGFLTGILVLILAIQDIVIKFMWSWSGKGGDNDKE